MRTEPRDWITNFEPNYLPQIEFYDEDFPWRYTPAAPSGSGLRLRPWIALVVLGEDEFEDGKNVARPAAALHRGQGRGRAARRRRAVGLGARPRQPLAVGQRRRAGLDRHGRGRGAAAGRARREPRPRVLAHRLPAPARADTAYHAFLVPVFESGRLAGLGHATRTPRRTRRSRPGRLPGPGRRREPAIYHRWYFRTGARATSSSSCGCSSRGRSTTASACATSTCATRRRTCPGIADADLGGVLRLGGALRVPRASLTQEQRDEVDRYENWAQPVPAAVPGGAGGLRQPRRRLQPRSPRGRRTRPPGSAPTPTRSITAPIYARWHALAAAAADRPRRHPRRARRQLGARAQPRPAPPRRRRLRHARRAGATRRTTWTRPGSRSATCWRPTAGSATRSWPRRSRRIWYERHLLAAARRASRSGCSRSRRPVQRHVLVEGLTLRRTRAAEPGAAGADVDGDAAGRRGRATPIARALPFGRGRRAPDAARRASTTAR